MRANTTTPQEGTLDVFDVIIIGGGLAGLCNAIHLSKFGTKVLLIEKNEYPKHKVCGEYISNEVLPYLNFLEINPFDFGAVKIDNFELSTTKNKRIEAKLPLGGFGISRFQLDCVLSEKAKKNGVDILQDAVVNTLYCHTIAKKSKERAVIFSSIGLPKTIDYDIKQEVQTLTGVLAAEILQKKSCIGAPLYYYKEERITNACSISHHGNFGAFAFTLHNEYERNNI